MRVVFGWDLGAGRGHAVRLGALVGAFAARGDEVLILARDLRTVRGVVGEQYPQLPAPHNTWFPQDVAPGSWSDILWVEAGLHDAAQANAILLAWRDLLQRLGPDLVVLDACPLAAPAARSLGIPSLSIGSGFMQPPKGPPWPVFRDWEAVDVDRIRQREARILDWCAAAGVCLSGPPVRLEADETVLFTYAPFDHYPDRKAGRYVGPMTGRGMAPAWPSGERRILLYLQPHYPYLDALRTALNARSDLAVVAFFGGQRVWADTGSLRHTDASIDVSAALADADLVIGHGGTMAVQVAAAGVPQLLLPVHAETLLLARRLQTLGLARMVAPPLQPAEFGPALATMLGDPAVARNATQALEGVALFDDQARCAAVLTAADGIVRTTAAGGDVG